MVSLHKALTMSPKKEAPIDFEASQKKRKWEDSSLTHQEFFKDIQIHDQVKTKSIFDIELHLKTPLPSDKWQQYLTLQPGKIQLCNTRMHMKTQESKKEWPLLEKSSIGQISLDLELNLACETLKKKQDIFLEEKKTKNNFLLNESSIRKINNKDSTSWLSSSSSLDGDDHDYKEMIATVCMRCHMLVMLCKSSPSCPNCKFMHPPQDQKFLKRTRFSFLS